MPFYSFLITLNYLCTHISTKQLPVTHQLIALNMRIFGLIGYPLSHTFSPTYFNEKFFREGIEGCNYQAFPLQNIADFEELLQNTPNLQGLNVTLPYKEAVLPFLDKISEEAQQVGAVNTIRIDKEK